MVSYQKPIVEIIVFDHDATVLTAGGCCEGSASNSYAIMLPELP